MLVFKKKRRSRKGLVLAAAGAATTAAVSLLTGSARGHRRRARLRDQVARAARETEETFEAAAHDIADHAEGVAAETSAKFRREAVSDSKLEERVRSALGRASSHPGSIEVTSSSGVITLRGSVLADEMLRVVRRVARVSGVKDIRNEMEPHELAGSMPGLQEGGFREERFEYRQERWAPAPRVLAGVAGAGLAAFGIVKRTPVGIGGGVAGLSLLLRSVTNQPVKRVFGVGRGRRPVDLQKEMWIDASIEEVYEFWNNPQNFPRFMTHVKDLRDLGDGRYHWKVEGPGSVPFEWDAEITQQIPNEVIAWRSLPGALVHSSGIVRFEPLEGGTRIIIRMQYNPPAGRLGHMFAKLLGSDPKQQMDDDLARFKSLLEDGKTAGDHDEIAAQDGLMG
jgi:uncharacterized membrane protein/osmotically-inducible protein OsmY